MKHASRGHVGYIKLDMDRYGFLKYRYPKSSMLVGVSLINHPMGIPIYENPHMNIISF